MWQCHVFEWHCVDSAQLCPSLQLHMGTGHLDIFEEALHQLQTLFRGHGFRCFHCRTSVQFRCSHSAHSGDNMWQLWLRSNDGNDGNDGNDHHPLSQALPSGKLTIENHHFLWENQLFLWQFSIAMLVYQRVLQHPSGPRCRAVAPQTIEASNPEIWVKSAAP